jgi:hypothetical protein
MTLPSTAAHYPRRLPCVKHARQFEPSRSASQPAGLLHAFVHVSVVELTLCQSACSLHVGQQATGRLISQLHLDTIRYVYQKDTTVANLCQF